MVFDGDVFGNWMHKIIHPTPKLLHEVLDYKAYDSEDNIMKRVIRMTSLPHTIHVSTSVQ